MYPEKLVCQLSTKQNPILKMNRDNLPRARQSLDCSTLSKSPETETLSSKPCFPEWVFAGVRSLREHGVVVPTCFRIVRSSLMTLWFAFTGSLASVREYFVFKCVYGCLSLHVHLCLCVCACQMLTGIRRGHWSYPLEQMIVSCLVGAGNGTWVLWKSSKCS